MQNQSVHGVVGHENSRRTDYLFRVSLKCLIRDDQGRLLVVKETGRDWWDLPGGGMDHGESIQDAIAREMYEEVGMRGAFTHDVVAVEEPRLLQRHSLWQMRVVFALQPELMSFEAGTDGDEIAFMDAGKFADSANHAERRVYEYSLLT